MAEAAKKKAPAKKTTTKVAASKKAAQVKAKKPAKAAAKPAAKKAVAKKPAAKKTAAKKPAVKRPAVKKAAAEKTTAIEDVKVENIRAEDTPSTKPNADQSASKKPDADNGGSGSHADGSGSHAGFDSERLIAELKEKDWGTIATRAFFMVFFGFLANIALMVTFILALVQFILMVGTGRPNHSVTSIILRLATYIGQALNFLSFRTEDKPFPMDLDLPSDS